MSEEDIEEFRKRKYLFSKKARVSDFRRTSWPKYLNLKAATLPVLPSLHQSVREEKNSSFLTRLPYSKSHDVSSDTSMADNQVPNGWQGRQVFMVAATKLHQGDLVTFSLCQNGMFSLSMKDVLSPIGSRTKHHLLVLHAQSGICG